MLKGGCLWVTHTSNTKLHKYTRVAKGQDGVEEKSIIERVLVKDMLCFVQDLRTVRGMGRGISDHQAVLCKVKLWGHGLRGEK